MTRDKGVVMMTLLGAEPHVDERQVRETIGAHTKITLRREMHMRPTSSRTSSTRSSQGKAISQHME
jgi:hypothetical protein